MSQHWAKQKERGNIFFLQLTARMVKVFPLQVMHIISIFVVTYFYLTSRNVRKNIKVYQNNLKITFPTVRLSYFSVYRQFISFAQSITDRFAVWQNKLKYKDLIIDDQDNLYQQFNSNGRGQILVCSHFGNIEICRALANNGQHKNFKLNVLVHHKNAEIFNKILQKAGAETLSLIQVEHLDAATMLMLANKIEGGEYIAIAADRVPIRGDKTCKVNFLSNTALFPQGAWLLSSLLKASVSSIFCIKESGKYRVKLRYFCDPITGRGKVREQNIQQAVQKYANLLAEECKNNPLLWFNFFNFWENK